MNVRVVLADDQELVRAGLRKLLEAEPHIEVVAEVANGREAVAAVRRTRPDIALLDIRMPVMDGLRATRQIIEDAPATRVVILTTYDLDEYIFEALRAGASGFLLKDSPAQDLVDALAAANRGDALLSPAVTRRLIEEFGRHPVGVRPSPLLDRLTPRELEVLRLVGRALTNAEIAKSLCLSQATVRTHMTSLFAKLGQRDRAQTVVFAYENGIVIPGETELM